MAASRYVRTCHGPVHENRGGERPEPELFAFARRDGRCVIARDARSDELARPLLNHALADRELHPLDRWQRAASIDEQRRFIAHRVIHRDIGVTLAGEGCKCLRDKHRVRPLAEEGRGTSKRGLGAGPNVERGAEVRERCELSKSIIKEHKAGHDGECIEPRVEFGKLRVASKRTDPS
jgi:hypothetical protein